MAEHIARAEIDIDAPSRRVWEALVNPALIAKYFFGSTVETDWEPGSRIVWRGEWEGKPYEDHGEVRQVVANNRLVVTHFSPLTGEPDVPENYHTLTYELDDRGSSTHLVLTQDNNKDAAEADRFSENWRQVLAGLKSVVEDDSAR
jgi:uncharacterized protein YndB with AHSA1/START domain